MSDFFIHLQKAFKISDVAISQIIVASALLLGFIKLLHFMMNHFQSKEDKQYEMLKEMMSDDNYIRNLEKKPYILKQLFFKRLYSLRRYQVKEIEYLFSIIDFNINLYQLDNLKNGGVLVYKKDHYEIKESWINNFWIKHQHLATILFLFLFAILIVVICLIAIGWLKSISLLTFFIVGLIFLEIYLINKHEAVKEYVEVKEELEEFIKNSIPKSKN